MMDGKLVLTFTGQAPEGIRKALRDAMRSGRRIDLEISGLVSECSSSQARYDDGPSEHFTIAVAVAGLTQR